MDDSDKELKGKLETWNVKDNNVDLISRKKCSENVSWWEEKKSVETLRTYLAQNGMTEDE